MKKVSVVIAAYNKADLTIRTVESVLNQTYANIEVIVVDDGSTDDTKQKLSVYADKIKYIYKENSGACSARNVGIRQASGDYIGLLDCDDIYFPEKIALSVDCLENNPEYGFVHTSMHYIDDNDVIRATFDIFPCDRVSGWIAEKLLIDNFISQSTVVARKSSLDKAGLFDESIFMPADWDLWLRLAEDFKAGYIDTPLTGYRSSHSYTMANLDAGKREELFVLNKALARKPQIYKPLKNKAISHLYSRYAKMFAIKGDMKNARKFFLKAVLINPFDFKKVGWLGYSFIFPSKTKRRLKKKRPLEA